MIGQCIDNKFCFVPIIYSPRGFKLYGLNVLYIVSVGFVVGNGASTFLEKTKPIAFS